ncbi:MAG: DMT family transporter, partial [Candidatus Hodarchaeota archaeon]
RGPFQSDGYDGAHSSAQRNMETGSEFVENEHGNLRVILLLILSVSMVSSASILIRFSTSDPLVIVFWRTLYGSLLMGSLALLRGDRVAFTGKQVRGTWSWLVLIGIVLCLHFATWFTSLFMTTVAASVVLVNTSPIMTALLSTTILSEHLSKQSWGGILIAIIGAGFLAWTDLQAQGAGALTGDLLALLSALFLAMYFIGGRRYTKGIPITVYTSIIYFVAAMATLALCIVLRVNVMVFELREVVIFLALAVFPTALGHSVNNYLLTLVPAYVVSVAVLGEPIGATILAMIFLTEFPSALTLIGFGVILLGIGLVLIDIAIKERNKRSTLNHTNRS